MRAEGRRRLAAPRTLLIAAATALAAELAACGPAASAAPPLPAPDAIPAGALCASCRMEIVEPAFVVASVTADGVAHLFDDVGCLVIELETRRHAPRSIHVRHVREPRWIDVRAAGFERHPATPMGFGFAAVDAPSELAFDEVRAEMAARFGLRADDGDGGAAGAGHGTVHGTGVGNSGSDGARSKSDDGAEADDGDADDPRSR